MNALIYSYKRKEIVDKDMKNNDYYKKGCIVESLELYEEYGSHLQFKRYV